MICVAMRPAHFIAPVIALAITGGIVGLQRDSISDLEAESAILRQRIQAARSRPEPGQAASRPGRTNLPTKEAIDWKEMAESFGDVQRTGGVRDMRKLMSFQRKLQAMDKDELVEALDRIAALELDDMQRMMLENMLIGPLAAKDPELALTRFAARIGEDKTGMGWQLASALGEWAKKDQSAAIAWLDKQIAAGTFDSKSLDGKSRTRMAFEGGLVARLLETDPQAAAARIAALPADQRKDVFQNFGFRHVKPEGYYAFADLARSQLSGNDRLEVLGKQAYTIATIGDFKKVEEYMDRIAATPDERIRSAEDAARGSIQGKAYQSKITTAEVDSMREWLATQAPGSVDKLTGDAIGGVMNHGGQMGFSEASELVLSYHAESGSDDLLTGFLEKAQVWQNKEEARSIAEKISDPQKREKALERLK